MTKATGISERAGVIPSRDDDVNKHDILTGSTLAGLASTAVGDTTCGNWTSNNEHSSALAGHFDRDGGGENPTSWNQAHGTKGCGQENLQSVGGDGLFYCFASIENTTSIDVDNIIPTFGYSDAQQSAGSHGGAPEGQAAPSPEAIPDNAIEDKGGLSSMIIPGIIALLLVICIFNVSLID